MIVAGVGFRRGVGADELVALVHRACAAAALTPDRLGRLATVATLADEPGFREAARLLAGGGRLVALALLFLLLRAALRCGCVVLRALRRGLGVELCLARLGPRALLRELGVLLGAAPCLLCLVLGALGLLALPLLLRLRRLAGFAARRASA